MPSVLLYLHDEHTGNFTLLYFTLLYFTLLYFTVISFTFRQSTVPDCLETCSGLLSHGQNKTRRESAAHSPCTTRFSTCDSKVCHWTRSRATFHIYLFIIPRQFIYILALPHFVMCKALCNFPDVTTLMWAGQRRRYSDWVRAGRSGDRIPVGARFSSPVQIGPGAHPASCTKGTGSFLGIKSGWGVTMTPDSLLVPWSRKSRAIPLLPSRAVRPVQSLSACTKVHSPFYYPNTIYYAGVTRKASAAVFICERIYMICTNEKITL